MFDSSWIIGGSLAVVLLLGVILLAVVSARGTKRTLKKDFYLKEWETIVSSIGETNSSMQFSILQADKLLDKALKESGYKGSSMGERMTAASRAFTKPDEVWSAHKLRNRIAHESNVTVSKKLTHRALLCFKKALKDLGAL